MSTARDILSDPLMAEQFLQWQAERAAEPGRKRQRQPGQHQPQPGQGQPEPITLGITRMKGRLEDATHNRLGRSLPRVFGKLETSLSRGPPLHHQVHRQSISRPSLSQHPGFHHPTVFRGRMPPRLIQPAQLPQGGDHSSKRLRLVRPVQPLKDQRRNRLRGSLRRRTRQNLRLRWRPHVHRPTTTNGRRQNLQATCHLHGMRDCPERKHHPKLV